MDKTTELYFGLLAGFALNIVASALYDWWKARRSDQAEKARAELERWKQRIGSTDAAVQADAFREVLAKTLFWFIVGNIMFAISGLTWVLEFANLYPMSNILASATSLVALVMFTFSLRWLRIYFKHRTSS